MLRNWTVIARVTSIRGCDWQRNQWAAVLWNINIFGSIYVAR
jgi:hypothetical protein